LTDCEGGRFCTVVEEAVFGTLLREGRVDLDTLKKSFQRLRNTYFRVNIYVIFNRGACWVWKSILVCLRQFKTAFGCPRICSAFLPSSSD
jgi:hypothetical protein